MDVTYTSMDLAQLFIVNVFSKHGVLSYITCNYGSKFISYFFRSLEKALDMHIYYTSDYHPEADS